MEENIVQEKQPIEGPIPGPAQPHEAISKSKSRTQILKAVIIAILIIVGSTIMVLAFPPTRNLILDQTDLISGRCVSVRTCVNVGSCGGSLNPESTVSTGCYSTSSHNEWKDPILKSQYKEIPQEKAQKCAEVFINENTNNQNYSGKGKSVSSNTNMPIPKGSVITNIDVSLVNPKDTYFWHFYYTDVKYYVGAQTCTVYPLKDQYKEGVIEQKSSVDTSNWKTHTNPGYGFSFKYPEDWVENGNKIEETNVDPIGKKGLSVNIYPNAGNLSALEFMDEIYYNDQPKNFKDVYMKLYTDNINPNLLIKDGKKTYVSSGGNAPYIKDIIIDGEKESYIDALIVQHGSDGNGVWISLGKDGLLLNGFPSAAEDQEKIFIQILSTFKFTK